MPAVSDTFAAGEELAEAILAGERKALPRHTVAKDTRPRRQQQARGARFQQQLATPVDDAPYVMRVWVRGATGLPAADVDGTADPYVEVELSLADGSTTHSKRTSAIQDNRDPRWEPAEELTFYLHGRDVEQAILNIRVYDEDSAKNDDQIAVCECDVSEDLSGADRTRLHLPIAHPTEGRNLRDGATLELDLWLSPVQGDDQDEKVCYEAEVARQKLKHAAEVVLLDTDGFGHASSAAWYKVFKVLDIDHSGRIDEDEFITMIRAQPSIGGSLGGGLGISAQTLSLEELRLVFDIIDTSEEGLIEVGEFGAFMRGSRPIARRQAARARRPQPRLAAYSEKTQRAILAHRPPEEGPRARGPARRRAVREAAVQKEQGKPMGLRGAVLYRRALVDDSELTVVPDTSRPSMRGMDRGIRLDSGCFRPISPGESPPGKGRTFKTVDGRTSDSRRLGSR